MRIMRSPMTFGRFLVSAPAASWPFPRDDVRHDAPQRSADRRGCQAKVAADFVLAVDTCRSRRSRDRRIHRDGVAAGHRQRRQTRDRPRQRPPGRCPHRARGGCGRWGSGRAHARLPPPAPPGDRHRSDRPRRDRAAHHRAIRQGGRAARQRQGPGPARAACTHWNGSLRTTPRTGRPSSTSSVPTCECRSPSTRLRPASRSRTLPKTQASPATSLKGRLMGTARYGSRRGRCVLPRSGSLPSICAMNGPPMSAPPVLLARVSGPASASISLALHLSTSTSTA